MSMKLNTNPLKFVTRLLSMTATPAMPFEDADLSKLLFMLKNYSSLSRMKSRALTDPNYVFTNIKFVFPELSIQILDSNNEDICILRFINWELVYNYMPGSLKHSLKGIVEKMTLMDHSQRPNHPMHMLIDTNNLSFFNEPSQLTSNNPAFNFELIYVEANRKINSNIERSEFASMSIEVGVFPFYLIFNRKTVAKLLAAYTLENFIRPPK